MNRSLVDGHTARHSDTVVTMPGKRKALVGGAFSYCCSRPHRALTFSRATLGPP